MSIKNKATLVHGQELVNHNFSSPTHTDNLPMQLLKKIRPFSGHNIPHVGNKQAQQTQTYYEAGFYFC